MSTTVTMFTSEIESVEINTLRDDLNLILPEDLKIRSVSHYRGRTFIQIIRKEESGG